MTIREQYRLVFHAPGGEDVINDLIGAVGRLAESERAGAYALIARITRMLHSPEPPVTARRSRTNGGHIAHG